MTAEQTMSEINAINTINSFDQCSQGQFSIYRPGEKSVVANVCSSKYSRMAASKCLWQQNVKLIGSQPQPWHTSFLHSLNSSFSAISPSRFVQRVF